jgi:hypothetical protein
VRPELSCAARSSRVRINRDLVMVQIEKSSQRMARHHFSRKYYNAPMPRAIFFH